MWFTELPFFAPLRLQALGILEVMSGVGVSMRKIYCRDKRVLFDITDSDDDFQQYFFMI